MESSRVLDGTETKGRTHERAEVMPRSLAEVYDAYSAPLYRYLLAMLRCEPDAEDAIQELFCALARADLGRVRDLQAYLFQAARRQAAMILRARRRSDREATAARISWLDPERCLSEDRAIAIDVDRALCALPAEQREVVVLHLSEGFSFREIGELCGIPQNTAASRYRLALARLREMLKGGDSGDG
jgi:RNA polymerase sigma-70 factor (ECF subfamily)